MSPNKKQIVSMLASEKKITLFTVEGELLDMKSDGPHDTAGIVEFLTPKLDGKSVVDIDLSDYLTLTKAIVPDGFEDRGIIVTQVVNGQTVRGIFYPFKVQVAVQHEGEEVVIPKVEKLEKHANRALADNSPAVRNFLRRLAPVAKDRLHSAEDLMDFIERSELPLTNDGLIIGYKKVNQKGNNMFVDVHSGKIEQQVGSHVWMDVDAVDPSRNQSCSHGLHVANLGYLSGFGGSHTLIVLVDPANFIAVPHGETNKARVCAYDVIGVMTARAHQMVGSGNFIVGEQTFASVVADAVAGRALKPFEAIKVGKKEILERTPIKGSEVPNLALEATTAETKESSGESLKKDPEKKQKDIRKMAQNATGKQPWTKAPGEVLNAFTQLRVGETKTAAAKAGGTSTRTLTRWMDKYDYDGWVKASEASMTVSERARQMFANGAYEALAAFKKAKKKSYNALGFNSKEEKQILSEISA